MNSKFSFLKEELAGLKANSFDEDYIIPAGLEQAVKVAMLLCQPLLLTGEPGTGKTKLAFKLAADLSKDFPDDFLPVPLIFNTKTISVFTDLFYTYDALGHFRETRKTENSNKEVSAAPFIQLQALGQAILLSSGLYSGPYRSMPELEKKSVVYNKKPTGGIVLIDEVDKAPRDFANDLLNELETMAFSVREDNHERYTAGKAKIIVIMTSNSEKSLPDAFLRRCIFYHIEPPSNELLLQIVLKKLFNKRDLEDNPLLSELVNNYIAFFNTVRNTNLKKEPATAELLSWLLYLKKHLLAGETFDTIEPATRLASLGVLVKHTEDIAQIAKLI